MHEVTVSSWVNDKGEPGRDNITAAAQHLGVETAWLAFGEGKPGPPTDPVDVEWEPIPQPPAPQRTATGLPAAVKSTVGTRLQAAMRLAGVSGRALATAVGVHETAVNAWMTDRKVPELDMLSAMAQHLDVTVAWLAFGTEADAPSRTLQGRGNYLTPLVPPASADSTSAVQSAIAAGQTQIARWLAEYSAALLEAAAADTRRQLGAVLDHEGNPVPHDDNDAEVERLNQVLRAQASESTHTERGGKSPARKRSSGA